MTQADTGDDSYHSECFRCCQCKQRIVDPVFAKAMQGIYCIDCHDERMKRRKKESKAEIREPSERTIVRKNKSLPETPKIDSIETPLSFEVKGDTIKIYKSSHSDSQIHNTEKENRDYNNQNWQVSVPRSLNPSEISGALVPIVLEESGSDTLSAVLPFRESAKKTTNLLLSKRSHSPLEYRDADLQPQAEKAIAQCLSEPDDVTTKSDAAELEDMFGSRSLSLHLLPDMMSASEALFLDCDFANVLKKEKCGHELPSRHEVTDTSLLENDLLDSADAEGVLKHLDENYSQDKIKMQSPPCMVEDSKCATSNPPKMEYLKPSSHLFSEIDVLIENKTKLIDDVKSLKAQHEQLLAAIQNLKAQKNKMMTNQYHSISDIHADQVTFKSDLDHGRPVLIGSHPIREEDTNLNNDALKPNTSTICLLAPDSMGAKNDVETSRSGSRLYVTQAKAPRTKRKPGERIVREAWRGLNKIFPGEQVPVSDPSMYSASKHHDTTPNNEGNKGGISFRIGKLPKVRSSPSNTGILDLANYKGVTSDTMVPEVVCTGLFGVDIGARVLYEGRTIPSILLQCVGAVAKKGRFRKAVLTKEWFLKVFIGSQVQRLALEK